MTDLLDRVRRPEYTGENRCWPCTITNGLLLTLVVGVLASRGRRVAAVAVAAVGTGAIALRGYVLPYTPRVAPRLVATLPIDPFDHGDQPTDTGSLSDSAVAADENPPAVTGEDVLAELIAADVVVPADEQLYLASDFRTEWRREIRSLREFDLPTLAELADEQTPAAIDTRAEQSWGRPILVLDGGGIPVTLRRGVAVAELAAARTLDGRVDGAVARAAGRPLRSLLESCPLCDGELTITQSSCCGETTPIGETPTEKLACPSCNERFFVFNESER